MSDQISTILSKIRGAGAPGQSNEDMLKEYKACASVYEQDYKSIGYQGHIQLSDVMWKVYDEEARKTIKVLDVAAGTGLVGKKLRESGFVHIDALDPSRDMLAAAREKNVYEKYFYEYITRTPLDIKEDSYDALVGSALFGHCHVPTEAIFEMIRLVKPGGHIVLVTRHAIVTSYDQYKDLEPTMDRLESEGRWMKVDRLVRPCFYVNHESIVWHYKVL